MGAKELFFSGLWAVGSGTVDTVQAVRHKNHRGIGEGIGTVIGGGLGVALGLTVGAVKLGAKAIKAAKKAAEEDQQ